MELLELPTIFFPYDIESKNAIYVKFCYKNFYMCLAYVQNINMNINQTKLNWDILIYHYKNIMFSDLQVGQGNFPSMKCPWHKKLSL